MGKTFKAMEASECCYKAAQDAGFKSWDYLPVTGSQCGDQENGTALEGELMRNEEASGLDDCCQSASQIEGDGFTYTPPTNGSTYGSCLIYKTVSGKKKQPSASSGYVNFGIC